MDAISDIVNCDDLDSYIKFAPKILGAGNAAVTVCNAAKKALEDGGVCEDSLDNVDCTEVMNERKELLENGDCTACCAAAHLITNGVDRNPTDPKNLAKKQIMSNYCNHLAGGTCKTGASGVCDDPTPQPRRERVQDFKSCVNDDDGNCKVDKNSNLIMVLFLLVLVALILGVVSIVKK